MYRDPFTATVDCSTWYKMGEEIVCRFSVTNSDPINNYFVLEWFTPLEGLKFDFLSITKDRKVLKYDAIMIRRSLHAPAASEYVLFKAGSTVTTEIDLSTAYAIKVAGEYTVQLQSQLHYHPEADQFKDSQYFTDIKQSLESNSVIFSLLEGDKPRKTQGEIHRQMQEDSSILFADSKAQQSGNPRDPIIINGTAAQHSLMKDIHRACYHYISAAADDINDSRCRYELYFGAWNASRERFVKQTFQGMKNALEQDKFTYIFNDPRCSPTTYLFTHKGTRKMWLCDMYERMPNLLGVNTKLGGIIHELSHAVMHTDDHMPGRQNSLNLAKKYPEKAINNAESYAFFVQTINIFNYGFDSMTRWTNGRTYMTRGNIYIRYSDSPATEVDNGYPKLITGNWGNLPDSFLIGFDSMSTLNNGKMYVTKGSQYVRYSGSKLDTGYPLPLQGNWGCLPPSFAAGFDSMTVLSNSKTYVTKGNQYIRYSDKSANIIDPGYPKPLQGYWGNLPASFANGFDSMVHLSNGKTFVTKNKHFIRYSDNLAVKVDPGYPQPIKGNWGIIEFP